MYEQLHLNPEEIELVLSGEIEKTAEEHALLYNYIRHVKFASLPDSFKYSYKFDEIQPHKFQSLFNQYLVTAWYLNVFSSLPHRESMSKNKKA